MKGIWKREDCHSGQAVSHQGNDGVWFAPQIIGWMQQPNNEPNLPVLTDITDGMVTTFKNTGALAEFLTNHGYMPCAKLIVAGGCVQYPENRLGLPVLLATDCKGS